MFVDDNLRKTLLDNFLNYAGVWTTSDCARADSGIQPSTDRQFDLANILASQLSELGLCDIQVTEHCYVYGRLPSFGVENLPSFCLLAHLDTVEECSGKDVKCVLSQKNGDTIISSDGSTLLGADDKAGIAEIMTLFSFLNAHRDIPHREIEVCFSPDEETGHGMDNVPLNLIRSKQAYTVDGGSAGELETECFNAYKSVVEFSGNAIHTGSGRGCLVNAVTMASQFVSLLPRNEAPETTDGYEGFFAPMEISGSLEKSSVTVFLRDFSMEGMKRRLSLTEKIAETVAESFGGSVKVFNTCQYYNMKNVLDKSKETVDNLIKAYRAAGIEPVFPPIRGGTDGSRLCEMGIPAPNIFTGGHNFHSRNEWASLNEMCLAVEVLINLAVSK